MTTTTRSIEKPVTKQANLAGGMFANTANLWGNFFWATANMNWQTAERGMHLTTRLFDASYKVAVESMTEATLAMTRSNIELWKASLGLLDTSRRHSVQAFDQQAVRQQVESMEGQRKTQIFDSNRPAQARTPIVEPERPAQGHTQVFEQHSPAQGRTQVFEQEVRLPDVDASFYFRGPDNQHNLAVDDLQHFVQLAQQVDEATWQYHLKRGDYSHWFRTAVQDEELAATSMRIEKQNVSPKDSRERILAAIRQRYTIAA